MKTQGYKKSNTEKRYATVIKQVIDLSKPQHVKIVAGRGTSKTTDILADRIMDVCYEMPRARFAIVSDTYTNALENVVPSILEGFNRKGWIEGVHYVTDVAPPDHFQKNYKPVLKFKHTISTYLGNLIKLGSLDQVSSVAGDSYQHVFGDEAKYLKSKKLNKLMPALRGFPEASTSPFYLGTTFTTDMPNVTMGDQDWILKGAKEMDQDKFLHALQVGIVINEIRIEMKEAHDKGHYDRVKKLDKNLVRWMERHNRVRKSLTFFHISSSLANATILGADYFINSLKDLGQEEAKASILSFKPNIEKGERFYINLNEDHFYYDGVNNQFYESKKLTETFEASSLALRYLNHKAPIEGGMDFGNQTSLVMGQGNDRLYRIIKEFHTLAPESSKELAKKFIDFFKYQKNKVLYLWYDRAGNQYQMIKRDFANEIKDHIENYEGTKTGWTVVLNSKNQANILQEEEYLFTKKLMGNYYPKLPELMIDALQCPNLKSSLELAKTKVTKNAKGQTVIKKDKSSEKLPIKQLPMYSTNYSDAFKYLLYRKNWVKISNGRSIYQTSDPEVY